MDLGLDIVIRYKGKIQKSIELVYLSYKWKNLKCIIASKFKCITNLIKYIKIAIDSKAKKYWDKLVNT